MPPSVFEESLNSSSLVIGDIHVHVISREKSELNLKLKNSRHWILHKGVTCVGYIRKFVYFGNYMYNCKHLKITVSLRASSFDAVPSFHFSTSSSNFFPTLSSKRIKEEWETVKCSLQPLVHLNKCHELQLIITISEYSNTTWDQGALNAWLQWMHLYSIAFGTHCCDVTPLSRHNPWNWSADHVRLVWYLPIETYRLRSDRVWIYMYILRCMTAI